MLFYYYIIILVLAFATYILDWIISDKDIMEANGTLDITKVPVPQLQLLKKRFDEVGCFGGSSPMSFKPLYIIYPLLSFSFNEGIAAVDHIVFSVKNRSC